MFDQYLPSRCCRLASAASSATSPAAGVAGPANQHWLDSPLAGCCCSAGRERMGKKRVLDGGAETASCKGRLFMQPPAEEGGGMEGWSGRDYGKRGVLRWQVLRSCLPLLQPGALCVLTLKGAPGYAAQSTLLHAACCPMHAPAKPGCAALQHTQHAVPCCPSTHASTSMHARALSSSHLHTPAPAPKHLPH